MPIVYAWTRQLELVLHGKLYITRIRASYTWQYVKWNIILRFYRISHACANSGAQAIAFYPPPQKTAWERGSLVPRPSRAPARKREDFLALLNQHDDVMQNDCHVLWAYGPIPMRAYTLGNWNWNRAVFQYALKSHDCFESCVMIGLPVFRTC